MAAGVTFAVKGIPQLEKAFQAYFKKADDGTAKAIARTALAVEADYKRNAQKQVYSNPREPNEITSRFLTSIHHEQIRAKLYRVISDTVYSGRLEYGFKPGVAPQQGVDVLGRQFHQQPRPMLQPAVDDNRHLLPANIVDELTF